MNIDDKNCLSSSFSGYRFNRDVKGDGNCYYRSIMFGMLEDAIKRNNHNFFVGVYHKLFDGDWMDPALINGGDPLKFSGSQILTDDEIASNFMVAKRFLSRCRKRHFVRKMNVTQLKHLFCKNDNLDLGMVIIARLVLFKMVKDNLDTMRPFDEDNSLRNLLEILGDDYNTSILTMREYSDGYYTQLNLLPQFFDLVITVCNNFGKIELSRCTSQDFVSYKNKFTIQLHLLYDSHLEHYSILYMDSTTKHSRKKIRRKCKKSLKQFVLPENRPYQPSPLSPPLPPPPKSPSLSPFPPCKVKPLPPPPPLPLLPTSPPPPPPEPFISILPIDRDPPPPPLLPQPSPLSSNILAPLFFDDPPPRPKTLKRSKSKSKSKSHRKKLKDIGLNSSEIGRIEKSDQIKSDELLARFLQDHPSAMP